MKANFLGATHSLPPGERANCDGPPRPRQGARRQPRRDCLPRDPDGAPPRAALGRGVLGAGRGVAARGAGGRGGVRGPRTVGPVVPENRRDPRRGAPHGGAGGASRLRLPLGERAVCRRGRRRRAHVHRAAGVGDAGDGLEGRGEAADGGGGRAAAAGVPRRGPVGRAAPRRVGGVRAGGGAPRAAEGGARRRRQGDADRALDGRAAGRNRWSDARGRLVLRRRPADRRALPAARAPHRGAGVRRHARRRRPPVRARLLGAGDATLAQFCRNSAAILAQFGALLSDASHPPRRCSGAIKK